MTDRWTEKELADRYQNQPWYIRRLRNFHYWSVPFVAIRFWYYEQNRELEDEDDWRFGFGTAWNIACGLAQGKQKHYYTWDEVKVRLNFDLDEKVVDNFPDSDTLKSGHSPLS